MDKIFFSMVLSGTTIQRAVKSLAQNGGKHGSRKEVNNLKKNKLLADAASPIGM